MKSGWIKLHRSFIDWEWYDQTNMVWLFLKCLLLANHENKKWHGIEIPRGSFITSYKSLSSKKAKVSVQQVRTSLNRLKLTGEITIKTTNKYTHIYVNNYDKYQEFNKQNNKQITNKQQTNNKQITTNKNNKNNKNEKNIYKYIVAYNNLFSKKAKITKGRTKKLSNRLKTYSFEDILKALNNLSKSSWHTGNNDRGWVADPDFLIRNDEQVDKWLNNTNIKLKKGGQNGKSSGGYVYNQSSGQVREI